MWPAKPKELPTSGLYDWALLEHATAILLLLFFQEKG
jgi:hypothetical protein